MESRIANALKQEYGLAFAKTTECHGKKSFPIGRRSPARAFGQI